MLQSLLLATARNRHFVSMVVSSFAISQISVRVLVGRAAFFRSQRYAFLFFFGLIWHLFYKFRVIESPILRFQRSFWNVHIVQRSMLPSLVFRPIFYAYNRHAQTVVCFVLSFVECLFSTYRYERETIKGFDGKEQFIDWAVHSSETPSKSLRRVDMEMSSLAPVVILIHGLGDDRSIPYIQRFCHVCNRRGWRAAVWSYWRCTFNDPRDLKCVVEHIQATNPKAPIAAVGYSAGGYILMRYLSAYGDAVPLSCAVTVSGCFDFVQAFEDVVDNENTSYEIFLGTSSLRSRDASLISHTHCIMLRTQTFRRGRSFVDISNLQSTARQREGESNMRCEPSLVSICTTPSWTLSRVTLAQKKRRHRSRRNDGIDTLFVVNLKT